MNDERDDRPGAGAGKRVAIVQSNYVPWRGYFDLIGSVDEFVLLDIVQFTKRDWRNRNRIKTKDGAQWLTVPVITSGAFDQTIGETRIAATGWAERHWRSIMHAYRRARYFERYADALAATYESCAPVRRLAEVNRLWLATLVSLLGIPTPVIDAGEDDLDGDRNGRLIAICLRRGATHYVSGPSARAYLDCNRFRAAGLTVEFMDYSAYEPYPQLHGGFEPAVSVLDLLLNTGPDAPRHLTTMAGRHQRHEAVQSPGGGVG